jgi:hypothetical protein
VKAPSGYSIRACPRSYSTTWIQLVSFVHWGLLLLLSRLEYESVEENKNTEGVLALAALAALVFNN